MRNLRCNALNFMQFNLKIIAAGYENGIRLKCLEVIDSKIVCVGIGYAATELLLVMRI